MSISYVVRKQPQLPSGILYCHFSYHMSGNLYPGSGHRILLGPCSCWLWNVSLHHLGFHMTLPSSLYFLQITGIDHLPPLGSSPLPWLEGRLWKRLSSIFSRWEAPEMIQKLFKNILLLFYFLPCCMVCGILVPWPEKAMAPHSSTLAWKTHGQRSLVGCSPWGR